MCGFHHNIVEVSGGLFGIALVVLQYGYEINAILTYSIWLMWALLLVMWL